MADLIDRKSAIDAICEDGTQLERQGQYSMTMAERKQRDVDILEALPSTESELENKIRAIGYTGKEGRIYIGGRLFAVRELAQ